MEMRTYRYIMQQTEDGAQGKATVEIIDTPGFASQLDNRTSWMAKIHEVETRLWRYSEQERSDMSDPRVHLCLYLLPPNPRPLRELDKRVLQEIQRLVPLLPVIAKVDTFDVDALRQFQDDLRKEFSDLGITPITDHPSFPSDLMAQNRQTPLGLIASSTFYKQSESNPEVWERCISGGSSGRLYTWGFADCDRHSDMAVLRRILTEGSPFVKSVCDDVYRSWYKIQKRVIDEIADFFHKFEQDGEAAPLKEKGSLDRLFCPKRLDKSLRMHKSLHSHHARLAWSEMFKQAFILDVNAETDSLVSAGRQGAGFDVQAALREQYEKRLIYHVTSLKRNPQGPGFIPEKIHTRLLTGFVSFVRSGALKQVLQLVGFSRDASETVNCAARFAVS